MKLLTVLYIMTIDHIFRKDRAALAPLAGITGSVFRRICRRFGAHPMMTEMVSADGLFHRGCDRASARLLAFHESERPIGVQLFGSDPGIMEAAAERILERKPGFIDINAEDEDECTFCEVCFERCPVNCIKIEKKY